MSGSLLVPRDQAVVAWAVRAVQAAGLLLVVATVTAAQPAPSAQGRGLAIGVALAVSAAGWIAWMTADSQRPLAVTGLIAMAVGGGVLAALSPASPAVLAGCMATLGAGASLPVSASAGITAAAAVSLVAASLPAGARPAMVISYVFAFAGTWAVGLNRRAHLARATQAELMLAETRRARAAETQAAALAERARIAREIHDLLAHSLSAVAVNLQAAEGLLGAGSLPAGNPDLAGALDCSTRAGAMARQGLVAARRAVLALREDPAPLPELLSSLAAQHRADGATVDLAITGDIRPVPAPAGLAAYRTAQEALTNARKHAPGEPVMLRLSYEPGQVTLTIINPLPPQAAARPLAATGAGYGLTGLTERAALAGGDLAAGPAGTTWQVSLRIPG